MKVRPDLRVHQEPGTYPPSEDTFLLLSALEVAEGETFLEVGTGGGLIALHAASLGARVVATDVDPVALRLARLNAVANGLAVGLVRADLLGSLRGPFDVVAFNPPYLPLARGEAVDPRWTGGPSGGEVIERFLRGLPRVLSHGGRAYVVVSSLSGGDWGSALQGWHAEVTARASLPFEELRVLLLRPSASRARAKL